MDERPTWQQSPPAKLGWWWYFRKGLPVPKLVQVFADGRGLRFAFHETAMASRALPTAAEAGHWWLGPITDEPPKKPE